MNPGAALLTITESWSLAVYAATTVATLIIGGCLWLLSVLWGEA